MAKRLDDRRKAQIIADYAQAACYRAVARRQGVSESTVKRLVVAAKDGRMAPPPEKAHSTQDMFAFMESRKGSAQDFIDLCLEQLINPERLEKAKLSEIISAMGAVIDKFTNARQCNESALAKLDKLLAGFDHEAKQ